jgi:hydroxymethyl cephem carbamoyltransferase
MLVVGYNTGHDGAAAVVKDREVLWSLEAEKDSFLRHAKLSPMTVFGALERLGETPDVIAVGGQLKETSWFGGGDPTIAAGYWGAQVTNHHEGSFCGRPVTIASSSHVRSHIMMAAGMAPPNDARLHAVLVWEGGDGSFYLLDEGWNVVREIPVLTIPGVRYANLFGIADPKYPPNLDVTPQSEAGKLMALAAYGDSADADAAGVTEAVERLLSPGTPLVKSIYGDAPFYNAGVEHETTKVAAALLQDRMFEIFAGVAKREIPEGTPLYITGGCGLNCDWNTMWRELGHFSSVFVPPCPNDSGSALGHALDALHALTGDPRVDWDVYCGLDFEWDRQPDVQKWEKRPLREPELADAIAGGRVVAWVQGRWEMGPRALGNRSLLADPSDAATRVKLNAIKQREGYRPIAPVCRLEDAGKVFDRDFHDPYMLYFRMVTSPNLGAVTHVDGSARAQTVTRESNRALHDLLTVYGERHGVGVLCNTSLNYKRMGFINRMSDLADYCERHGVPDMVVGDAWFQRLPMRIKLTGPRPRLARLVSEAVERRVPEGSTVLVISGGLDEMVNFRGRTGWHFPQRRDGTFDDVGPADTREVITRLEVLMGEGATHLVIPKPSLWWLVSYAGLQEHLQTNHRLLMHSDGGMIFALEGSGVTGQPVQAVAPVAAPA